MAPRVYADAPSGACYTYQLLLLSFTEASDETGMLVTPLYAIRGGVLRYMHLPLLHFCFTTSIVTLLFRRFFSSAWLLALKSVREAISLLTSMKLQSVN